ncbi:MAG: formylglycine-generating enzyme family protein [Verrucomicrobiales bacterium]
MNPTTTLTDRLPLYPPAWADKFGEDDFGIFACFFLSKVEFEFRWIPPGRFWMGSPKVELGRFDDEGPRTEREVGGFWLGTTPVTQAQWLALRRENPSHFDKGGQYPVEQVSWLDAVGFARELSGRTGAALRLPEEREWEYACRAGTESALYTGEELTSADGKCLNLDEIAWYDKNSDGATHEVGGKQPNAWGLQDMLGNVWEWCADPWDAEAYAKVQRGEPAVKDEEGARRVVRGGSWFDLAWLCRAAFRLGFEPDDRRDVLGFRLAAGQEPRAAEPQGSGAPLPERRSRARRAGGGDGSAVEV